MNYSSSALKKCITSVLLGALISQATVANALVFDDTYTNSGDYSFDSNTVEVTGGEGVLKGISFVDDAEPGEFGAGTFLNTVWDGLSSALQLQTPSTTPGTFTSRIFDSNSPLKPWTGFSWLPKQAYGKALPDSQNTESGYTTNVDMSNNVLLLHGEEVAGTTLVDSSGQGNDASCTNCPTLAEQGKVLDAPLFDGIDDSAAITDAANLDFTNAATIESWIKVGDADFAYKRSIDLENPTVLPNIQVKVELDNSNFIYTNAQSKGQDVRFTDATGEVLPHWIEFWDRTDSDLGFDKKSRIWVKVPTTGTSAITMHYGNPEVENTSNGNDVFPRFENAEHSLDTTTLWNALDTSGSGYNSNKLAFMDDDGFVTSGFAQQTAWVSKTPVNTSNPLSFESSFQLQTLFPNISTASTSSVPTYCQGFYNAVGNGAAYAFCWHVAEKVNKAAMTVSKSYAASHSLVTNGLAFSQPHYNQPVNDGDPLLPGQRVRLSTLFDRSAETLTVSTEGDNSVAITNLGSYNEYGRDGGNALQFDPTTPVVYGKNGNSIAGTPTDYSLYLGGDAYAFIKYDWAFLRNVDTVGHTTDVGVEQSISNAVPYAGSWMYERTLTINGTVPENDYQIMLPNTMVPWEKMHQGANDIRFYQASDGVELPFWKEGETGNIWIKLINKDESTLVMRYGNPGATDTKYRGEDVFLLFDEFNGRQCLEANTANPDCVDSNDGLGSTYFDITTQNSQGQDQTLWTVNNYFTNENPANGPTNNGLTAKLENGRLNLGAASALGGSAYTSTYQVVRLTTKDQYAPLTPATTGLAMNIKSSFHTGGTLNYACWSFGNQFDSPAVSQSNRLGFWVPSPTYKSAMQVYNGSTNTFAPGYDQFECPPISAGSATISNENNGVVVGDPVVGADGGAYAELTDFIMAKDGLRRKRSTLAAGAPANLDQTADTTTYPTFSAYSDQGRVSFFMNGGWWYDAKATIDRVILRKSLSVSDMVEPSFTNNNDEKIIGAGKHGAYGFAFTGNKVYATFGSIDQGTTLSKGWNHIAATFDGAVLRLYKRGAEVANQNSVFAIPNTTNPFEIGAATVGTSTPSRLAKSIILDDLALYSRVLSPAEILTRYIRNGLSLLLQLRSCDDAACDTEQFVGPDGTSATYYDESTNTALTPPSVTGPNVGNNRYAQYLVTLVGDGIYTPALHSVQILPNAYSALNPIITSLAGFVYHTIAGIVETAGAAHTGALEYQVTINDTDWYYWNTTTSTWVEETGSGYPAETNTAAEVNSGLPFLPMQLGTGTLKVRTYLVSNGGQLSGVDNLQFTYGTTNQAPDAPTAVYVNTSALGAQTGRVDPLDLSSDVLVASALTSDPDLGDVIKGYRIQVASDMAFTAIVYDSNNSTFPAPFLAGNRMSDISIPASSIDPDTTYFLRIYSIDSSDNVSPPSNVATFLVPDTTAPTLSSSNPADNDTGVSPNANILLHLTDDLSGVDPATIVVDINGVNALTGAACQAGFSCTVTPVGNGYTVEINPIAPFAYNSSVDVDWQVADSATVVHTASGSFTFDIATNGAPDAPTDLYSSDSITGASAGQISPVDIEDTAVVVSAIHNDPDGDAATKYRLQIATDSAFGTVVHDETTTLGLSLNDGSRVNDITVPANILEANTTYYWRIKFWDNNDFEGSFSPAGLGAAEFTIVDATLPALLSASPANATTAIARNTDIALEFDDALAGIDSGSMDITIGSTMALLGGVCQTGFSCTVTPVGKGYSVLINPDVDFGYNESIQVGWSVSDLATVPNQLTGNQTFTTEVFVPPVNSWPEITGGSGGGGSTGYISSDTSLSTSESSIDRSSGPTQEPNDVSGAESQSGAETAPYTFSFMDGSGRQVALDLQLLVTALTQGSDKVANQSQRTTPETGNSNGGGAANITQQLVTQPLTTLTRLFSAVPTVSPTSPAVPDRTSAPQQVEGFSKTICSQLNTIYSYAIPKNLPVELTDDINLLHKIGVNFSKGQKLLDVSEPVTRSELLKYLLQSACSDYGYDIQGVSEFPDVAKEHQNYLYVQVGRKYGLVSGYKHDGLFRADQQITQAEALKVILEFFSDTSDLDGSSSSLPIDYSQWYGRYVRFAEDAGILDGVVLNPDAKITLADVIHLLVDSLPLKK